MPCVETLRLPRKASPPVPRSVKQSFASTLTPANVGRLPEGSASTRWASSHSWVRCPPRPRCTRCPTFATSHPVSVACLHATSTPPRGHLDATSTSTSSARHLLGISATPSALPCRRRRRSPGAGNSAAHRGNSVATAGVASLPASNACVDAPQDRVPSQKH